MLGFLILFLDWKVPASLHGHVYMGPFVQPKTVRGHAAVFRLMGGHVGLCAGRWTSVDRSAGECVCVLGACTHVHPTCHCPVSLLCPPSSDSVPLSLLLVSSVSFLPDLLAPSSLSPPTTLPSFT